MEFVKLEYKNKSEAKVLNQSDRANIFERFYKSKVLNKKDSIGIGLSIAKTIIEDHSGYINTYPHAIYGSFEGLGYWEIVDFGVLGQYGHQGIVVIKIQIGNTRGLKVLTPLKPLVF